MEHLAPRNASADTDADVPSNVRSGQVEGIVTGMAHSPRRMARTRPSPRGTGGFLESMEAMVELCTSQRFSCISTDSHTMLAPRVPDRAR